MKKKAVFMFKRMLSRMDRELMLVINVKLVEKEVIFKVRSYIGFLFKTLERE